MSGDKQHDVGGALDRITESVVAKLAVRVILPLITLVSIPLIAAQWNAMRSDIGAVKSNQTQQDGRIVALDQQVTTINTKLDAGLIWRLSQLERRFEAMEARVERREAQRPGN